MLSESPKTIDIACFFEKFCIAIRTKKKRYPFGYLFFWSANREDLNRGGTEKLSGGQFRPPATKRGYAPARIKSFHLGYLVFCFDDGKGLEGRVMDDLSPASHSLRATARLRTGKFASPVRFDPRQHKRRFIAYQRRTQNNVHRSPDRSRNFRNKSIHSANTPWIHSKKPYFYTPSDMLKNMPSVRHG